VKLGRESDDRYVKSVALSSLGVTLFRQGSLREANLYYQESLELNLEIGDKVGLSLIHCYLGLLALAQDQSNAARGSFVEGLTIAHQSAITSYLAYNLIGMASLYNREGRLSDCLVLLAAATRIAESISLKIEPELQEPYDKAITEARKKLSEEVFQSAWEAGEKMDIERAVKFAKEK